jgi:fatty acid desaturase
VNQMQRKAAAWAATWLTCAALILHWMIQGMWEPALILAVVQFSPAFYAGEAFDRSRRYR